MQNLFFKVDEDDSDMRLDNYLSAVFTEYSRTKLQSLIKQSKILVNNKPSKPSFVLRVDDEIVCDLADLETKIEPEPLDIEVICETDDFAVINKPSGMLTHPTSKEKTGTLVNALLYRYGENLSDLNGDYRRGIIHRLDRNTSGLIIIAKNNKAHEVLSGMIKDRQIEKHYRTIVRGRLESNLTISEPIGRSRSNPKKMSVVADGKPSLTEVGIIEQFSDATYLDVNLKTGRTHQIRVHLSHLGHPVFNDTLYGFGKMKIKTEEQVLQSYKLLFKNPFDDKIMDIEIEPDEKIKKVLQYLRSLERS